jgi:histidyl-tRNA synthetase|tara:strand:+ start:46521 stop:47096 length:576 start_codon:yes stop_codon:yes gene_type:complete
LKKSEVVFIKAGFNEIIIPSIWDFETFSKKTGEELKKQMWVFNNNDKKECCLIPEVTGILQEQFRNNWFFEYKKKPLKLFYVNRCYRYEKPQKGRYREFTQLGIEILGGRDRDLYTKESKELLISILNEFKDLEYDYNDTVTRGLGYYLEDGFEVECQNLGAQKQIAGGGKYEEGVGWAIGIDRLILALQK